MAPAWRRISAAAFRKAEKWRLVPGALILLHLVVVASFIPLEDRWYVSPDDGDVLRYGRAILERGVPVLSTEASVPAGANATEGYLRGGNFLNSNGEIATVRPPLIFYLLAPSTNFGTQWILASAQILTVASLVAIYALFEKIGGQRMGNIALMTVLFHPSFLYWSWTLKSNILGVGLLAFGVRLLMTDRPLPIAGGGMILATLPLARFELGVPAALGGLWAFGAMALKGKETMVKAAALAGAGLFGLAVVLALSWRAYGTLDLLDVVAGRIGSETSGETPLSGPVNPRDYVLSAQLERYSFLIFLPLTSLAGASMLSARRSLVWIATLGCFLLTAYIFSGTYTPQPFFMHDPPTRYMLPLVLAAAMVLAHALRRAPKGARVTFLAAVLISSFAAISFLQTDGGYRETRDHLRYEISLVESAESMPADAIVVGAFMSNVFPDRYALIPESWPDPVGRRDQTVKEAHNLLNQGFSVIGEYQNSGQFPNWIDEDPRMETENRGLLWSAKLSPQSA